MPCALATSEWSKHSAATAEGQRLRFVTVFSCVCVCVCVCQAHCHQVYCMIKRAELCRLKSCGPFRRRKVLLDSTTLSRRHCGRSKCQQLLYQSPRRKIPEDLHPCNNKREHAKCMTEHQESKLGNVMRITVRNPNIRPLPLSHCGK